MENIAVAVDAGHTSLWGLFMQAGWVVKAVMIGLVLASVWSWAIVFEKIVSFRKMRAAIDRFEQTFWSGQSLEELYRTLVRPRDAWHGLDFRRRHARMEKIL